MALPSLHGTGNPGQMTGVTTRVLYIAGAGRSGTTLLASVLGQVPGLFSVGELRYMWERGLMEDGRCGCGAAFGQCPTWQRVLGTAFAAEPGGGPPFDLRDHLLDIATDAVDADRQATRVRQVPLLLAWRKHPQRLARRIQPHVHRLGRLYGAISATTGCEVVVDSSKLPGHAFVVGTLADIELFVVHLVRDPRGVAHSWHKHRENPDRPAAGTMARAAPLESALLWNLWNATTEFLWGRDPEHYLQVRYEDFVVEPEAVCSQILALLGRDDDRDAVEIDGRTLKLAATHSVAGNPDRLRHGEVELRADSEWTRRLTTGQAALVTALTAPLLRRYGYPLTRTGVPGVRLADVPPLAHTLGRVRKNLGWVRDRGWAPFFEEHELDPRQRVARARARRRWRRAHPVAPGAAAPVLVVGLQRSGTNMLVRALASLPEMEVHSENDRRAFQRYQLRPVPVVRQLVAASRHRYVVLKPLCDSHRTDELLDVLAVGTPGRAIWMYRGYEDRARSSLAKFGDSNLSALRDLGGDGPPRWQLQCLSPESLELIARFDLTSMSPASGAALLWYVRNQLYFERGFHQRDDIALVSYDALVADPPASMRPLCAFLGVDFHPRLVHGLARRPPARRGPLELDPLVRRHCDELEERLDDAVVEKAARITT